MILSKPILVTVEIEDIKTGCTYIYSATHLKDCTDYFKSLFIDDREFKIINYKSYKVMENK